MVYWLAATVAINRIWRCYLELKVLHTASIFTIKAPLGHIGHISGKVGGGWFARATLEATHSDDDLRGPALMAAGAAMPLACFSRDVGVAGCRRRATTSIDFGGDCNAKHVRDLALKFYAYFPTGGPWGGFACIRILLHLADLLIAHACWSGWVTRAVDLTKRTIPRASWVDVVDEDVVRPWSRVSTMKFWVCICSTLFERRGEERGKAGMADLKGAYQQWSLPPSPLSQSSLIFTPSPSLKLLWPWAHVGSVSLVSQLGSPKPATWRSRIVRVVTRDDLIGVALLKGMMSIAISAAVALEVRGILRSNVGRAENCRTWLSG